MDLFIEMLPIIRKMLSLINGFMYSKFLILLLVFTGVYFTIRTRAVQVRLLPEGLRVLKEGKGEGGISSFQALMISTASRVGTGNISGVALALVAGGYGAIFWMWLMAIIGGASAFIESTLAQVYKERDGDVYKGGPAYFIEKALHARWLGIIFAISLILAFAFGFNALQTYTMVSSFEYYTTDFEKNHIPIIAGIIVASLAGVVFFGGAKKIGMVTSIIVPIMAGIYVLLGVSIIVIQYEALPQVFSMIFREAFDFEAIFGGFAGSCVVIGTKRGLFSNEAGMGSAPNAAAVADVSHPAKQGLVQVIAVFIDTLIICSTTAMVVFVSGKYVVGGELTAIPLIQSSVGVTFGEAGIHFITLSICLFAFTSLIGNYYYAEANFKFIIDDKKALNVFRLAAIGFIFVGANLKLTDVWDIADILMGVMSTINIGAILLLGGIAIKVLKDYDEQLRQGLTPVFHPEKLGIKNTSVWK